MLISAFSSSSVSSLVRLPLVLMASISRESSTVAAALRLTDVSPVAGFGSCPRNRPAF